MIQHERPLDIVYLGSRRLLRRAGGRGMPRPEAQSLARELVVQHLDDVRRLVCAMTRRPGLELERTGRPELARRLTDALCELLEDGRLALRIEPPSPSPGGSAPRPSSPPKSRRPRPSADDLVLPRIDVAPIVLCPHDGFTPRRVALSLRADRPFDGEGELSCSRGDVSLSRTRDVEESLEGPTWVFDGANLTQGVTLYVRFPTPSASPADISFTLTLSGGSKPVGPPDEIRCTAVRATLDLKTDPRGAGGDRPISTTTKYEAGRLIPTDDPRWHNGVGDPLDAAADETRALDGADWNHPRTALEIRVEPAGVEAAVRLDGAAVASLHVGPGEPWDRSVSPRDRVPFPWVAPVASLPAGLWLQGRAPGQATLRLSVVGHGEADRAEVVVGSVRLGPSEKTRWGYDEMDELPGRVHHVSLPDDGDTTLALACRGLPAARLSVSSAPAGVVATHLDPASGELRLQGLSRGVAMVHVRLDEDGPVVAAVAAHTYPKVSLSLAICKCIDPGSPATDFEMPQPPPEVLRQRVNEMLRPIVAEVNHIGYRPTRRMPFDPDGNGVVPLAGEHDMGPVLTKAEPEPGFDRTALVLKDLVGHFPLVGPLRKGQSVIEAPDPSGHIGPMEIFDQAHPQVRERVVRVSRTATEIHLEKPLRHDYERPAHFHDAGGFGPMGQSVLFIDIDFDFALVVAHELCHSVLQLEHVIDPHDGNLMNRWHVDPPRLRFRRLPLMSTETGVAQPHEHRRQWDEATRPRF